MKFILFSTIFLLLTPLLASCSTHLSNVKVAGPEKIASKTTTGAKMGVKKVTEVAIWSRITFYHNKEDEWGNRVAACPKMRNKPGVGVAAHPDFKFFTNIRIPELKGKLDSDDKFQVIDRGGAVTKKRAFTNKGIGLSGKKYVFDVYVPRREYSKFVRNSPQYAWVIVEM